MNNPLSTPEDYELLLYTLTETFPSVLHCTLTFVRKGASLARVAGELYSNHNIHLVVRERIVYHRIPAPKMSFTRPNLTELIREIESLLKGINTKTEQN